MDIARKIGIFSKVFILFFYKRESLGKVSIWDFKLILN